MNAEVVVTVLPWKGRHRGRLENRPLCRLIEHEQARRFFHFDAAHAAVAVDPEIDPAEAIFPLTPFGHPPVGRDLAPHAADVMGEWKVFRIE